MADTSAVSGLGRSAGLAAAAALAARATAQPATLGIGLLGLGPRGLQRLAQLGPIDTARVVAVCDPDETTWTTAPAGLKPTPSVAALLADPGVQAVVVATPTHWTAEAGRLALEAGKHVLLEAPACWSFAEGQALLTAAAKSQAMAAVAHDQRGFGTLRDGVARAWAGTVGAIHTARAIDYRPYVPRPATPNGAPPRTLHWQEWRGPAVGLEYNAGLLAGGWAFDSRVGLGPLGGAALDALDAARWLLNSQDLPVAVYSSGGRFAPDVPGDQPNVQHAVFTLPDKRSLAVEIRGLPSPDEAGLRLGAVAYGANGWLNQADGFAPHVGHQSKGQPPENLPAVEVPGQAAANALENFVQAVLAAKPELLNCSLAEGVRSAQFAALAGISYKLGRALAFDPAAGRFVNAAAADRLLSR